MTEIDLIPVFDGHNDTLLRLYQSKEADVEKLFIEGTPGGHIDLPRANKGGFAGGMFAIFPPPIEKTKRSVVPPAPSDNEPLPPELPRAEAITSTIGMASILFRLERAGALTVCRSAGDIREAMAKGSIAAVFHIEGVEAIDPELAMLDVLHAAGLRSLGIVWSRPNAFGNGVPFRFPSSPDTGPGLTDAGKALVKACNQLRIMIDLSHLNEKGFRDVAALSDAPLVATHSNVHAICGHSRNLTDWQLGAIRESGGMVGLNFATGFLREDGRMNADTGLDIMVRHIDSLLQALGEDGVGLGSDFDGAMIPAVIGDVAGLPKLIEALAARGFGRALIDKIAYRNWLSVLERTIG
ncbi:MAG: membrane dipeptidase [Mesorhizobium sp.]|uniref:dipeptidase n=1 Tax=Mesorhizobium sp. TaxID=1871066 RepID=UPI000FE4BF4F|nr:dipeptidase [Mesorhizobium sp.]RWM06070.1 MAG: membrane dipeptidase [Mesorhizobium sp.]TIO52888.1 MAG: membrane dipeptidase [Mesorhizobium sp.]TIO56485.1 MAG: membrane dipeptidase [Mesorhizobium sp.]TJV60854.1 MAG: membrane dipeptidase [Mesorhizobium sp.]